MFRKFWKSHILMNYIIWTNYYQILTLFIMSELINSKLATAGSGHFELQKYPPKENYVKKIAVSPGIRIWDQ